MVRKFGEFEPKLETAPAAENAGMKSDIPLGAIENGRAFADRLESYQFECEGGSLNMCSDWQEFRRCFEYLSEWAMHSQTEHPATNASLTKYKCPIAHKLKILPKYFAAVCAGTKRAELRKNDRDYRVGDVLILEEVLPGSDMTGKSVCVHITHVADVSDYAPGYVLLSIAQVWIPCSERLPEEYEDVLITVRREVEDTPLVCTAYRVRDMFLCDWDTLVIKTGSDVGEAAHWMPLPALPINVTVEE